MTVLVIFVVILMLMVVIISLLGLVTGSFINAVVWRLHEQSRVKSKATRDALSITKGRSMCPNCHHPLSAIDLVPVVSWVLLGRRCRYCHQPISWQYPVVELLTAGLFGVSYKLMRPTSLATDLSLGLWLVILSLLIILTVYDLRWMILPDAVILPTMVVAVLKLVVGALQAGSLAPLVSPVIAALVAGGAFYALAAVSNGKWMGGGDIKLAFVMGLILGLPKLGLAMLIGFNSAALIGVGLMIMGVKKRSDYIPFGPFLAGATVVAYLYGQSVIDWYVRVGLQVYR